MLQHHIEACAKVSQCICSQLCIRYEKCNEGSEENSTMRSVICDPLCYQVPNMKEILLIGFYQPNEELSRFLFNAQQEFKISIR